MFKVPSVDDWFDRHVSHLALVFVCILLLNVAINYALSPWFGFYDDDWAFFAKGFNEPGWAASFTWAWTSFVIGRPLQFWCMFAGQWILYQTQSILALYIVAALALSFGVWLWYIALTPKIGARYAFVWCVALLLLPLHSLSAFLNGVLGFWLAMSLSAAGLLAWRLHPALRFPIIAVTGFLTLCTYEVYFFPLFLAPILTRYSVREFQNRALWRDATINAIVLLAVLAVYVGVRKHLDIARSSVDLIGQGQTPFGLLAGFVSEAVSSAFGSFGYLTSRSWPPGAANAIPLAIGVFIAVLIIARFTLPPRDDRAPPWEIAIIGALLVLAGYAIQYLMVHHAGATPGVFFGRISRFNLVATMGHAMLWTALFALVDQRRPVLLAIFALPVALFALNRATVQTDIAANWKEQQSIIAQVIALSPDAREGTAILLNYGPRSWEKRALGGDPQGWPYVLSSLYRVPQGGPEIRRVWDGWQGRIKTDSEGWFTFPDWPPHKYKMGNAIVLTQEGRDVVRRIDDPVFIDGKPLNLPAKH